VKPWESASDYSQLTKELEEWEALVPPRHRWSLNNLRGHKAEFLDLAYLSQVMVVRISNIVIRRIYLEDILSKMGASASDHSVPEFWTRMSHELFANVCSLHESFDTWFSLRSADEGIPSIVVFSVYICGSLASYLWKWPQLCPKLAGRAEPIVIRSLEVLAALMVHLPHVSKWLHALQRIAVPLQRRDAADYLSQSGGPTSSTATVQVDAQDMATSGLATVSTALVGSVTSPKDFEANIAFQANLEKQFTGIGQSESTQFHYPPPPADNYVSWPTQQVGGVTSLDSNTGYSFDEELMRLLAGDL
jgi:hypothetical protein